jgi:hypothetical protein
MHGLLSEEREYGCANIASAHSHSHFVVELAAKLFHGFPHCGAGPVIAKAAAAAAGETIALKRTIHCELL